MTPSRNRAGRLLNYLAEVMVNGPSTPLPTSLVPPYTNVEAPKIDPGVIS